MAVDWYTGEWKPYDILGDGGSRDFYGSSDQPESQMTEQEEGLYAFDTGRRKARYDWGTGELKYLDDGYRETPASTVESIGYLMAASDAGIRKFLLQQTGDASCLPPELQRGSSAQTDVGPLGGGVIQESRVYNDLY